MVEARREIEVGSASYCKQDQKRLEKFNAQTLQARENALSSLGTRLEQKEEEVKQREMEVNVARSEAATKVSSCKIKSLPHQQQHDI